MKGNISKGRLNPHLQSYFSFALPYSVTVSWWPVADLSLPQGWVQQVLCFCQLLQCSSPWPWVDQCLQMKGIKEQSEQQTWRMQLLQHSSRRKSMRATSLQSSYPTILCPYISPLPTPSPRYSFTSPVFTSTAPVCCCITQKNKFIPDQVWAHNLISFSVATQQHLELISGFCFLASCRRQASKECTTALQQAWVTFLKGYYRLQGQTCPIFTPFFCSQ